MTQTLFIVPPASKCFHELWQTSVFKLFSRPDEAENSDRVQLGSARRTLQNLTEHLAPFSSDDRDAAELQQLQGNKTLLLWKDSCVEWIKHFYNYL